MQKYQSRDWYKPIVQALAPFSLGGCRAVIGLVPRATLIGILFDCNASKIRALILAIIYHKGSKLSNNGESVVQVLRPLHFSWLFAGVEYKQKYTSVFTLKKKKLTMK